MKEPARPVTRVLSPFEAEYLFARFEDVHCTKQNETGEEIAVCPGWDWNLTHLDDSNKEVRGGCKYKNSKKLCSCLKLAAEDNYVVEIRPKNEDDLRREADQERSIHLEELRKLKQTKTDLDEKILALESKIRQQV